MNTDWHSIPTAASGLKPQLPGAFPTTMMGVGA